MRPILQNFGARLRRRAVTATIAWTAVSLSLVAGPAAAAVVAADPAGRTEPTTPVSFIRDVAPVLMDRCLGCHDEASAKGAYRLDTFEQMLVPGDSGRTPVVVPGRPEDGSLYALLITEDADDRMPRKGDPLEPAALAVIRRWIAEGAAFDGVDRKVAWIGEADAVALPAAPDTYTHPVPVSAAAVLPDGTVAVGGFREILLWSPEGRLIRRVSRVPERIQALVFRPDGAGLYFAGGAPGRRGAAGTVGMGEGVAEAGQPFHRTGDTLLALAVAVTREGTRVAVAGTDRGIAIHEGPGLGRVRTLGGHSDWVLDLAFDEQGARLVSAGRDRTARVHRVADGSLLAVFRDHSEAVTAAVFLPKGERVVTAGRDGRLRAWNPTTGKDARASKPIGARPTRLLAADGRLWSAWSDGRIREHRADNLELVRELGEAGEPVLGLAMAGPGAGAGAEPGPGRLVATRHDGWIQVWDPGAGTLRHAFLSVPPH